nr:hypothetical protein [Tanacetum cinerariifolium]
MSYDNGDWYSLTPSRDKIKRLEKANAWYKSVIEKSSETERQQLFKIKELQDENKILKSKVIDCTKCQIFQEKLKELNSINESLTASVQKLLNLHERGKAKLTQRDEKIFVIQKKLRLLEEQSKVFHEVQSKCDSEIFHDTKDNSEKDLILSLQTQLQETTELVVRFADEKYFVSKENESLKDDIKSLQTENNVPKSRESELSEKIEQMKSQVSELSKQIWTLKRENISKRFTYSRNEMFSMRKRDDSVLKKVKDVRFPFISKRIFLNKTPGFSSPWNSTSMHQIDATYIWFSKYGMYNLDLQPLSPKLRKNREAHVDYLKQTKEHADILYDIIEQDRALKPSYNALDFACKFTTRIQELLVYVSATCPSPQKESEKFVAFTPMRKKKKVRAKSGKSNKKNEWKPMGKVFTNVGH